MNKVLLINEDGLVTLTNENYLGIEEIVNRILTAGIDTHVSVGSTVTESYFGTEKVYETGVLVNFLVIDEILDVDCSIDYKFPIGNTSEVVLGVYMEDIKWRLHFHVDVIDKAGFVMNDEEIIALIKHFSKIMIFDVESILNDEYEYSEIN